MLKNASKMRTSDNHEIIVRLVMRRGSMKRLKSRMRRWRVKVERQVAKRQYQCDIVEREIDGLGRWTYPW